MLVTSTLKQQIMVHYKVAKTVSLATTDYNFCIIPIDVYIELIIKHHLDVRDVACRCVVL